MSRTAPVRPWSAASIRIRWSSAVEPGGQPGVGGEDLFSLGAPPLAAGAEEPVGGGEIGAGAMLRQ